VLAARGGIREARAVLAVDKPSLALVVRSAVLASGAERVVLAARARGWLDLEASRGDAMHYREAAILALLDGSPADALAAARRNFELQKELPDVRVLARAAQAARDAGTLQSMRRWLRETGYRDAVTESILGPASSS